MILNRQLFLDWQWFAAVYKICLRFAVRCLQVCKLYRQRYRTRRQLLELSARQLDDIGLDLQQARAEGNKPFWRP
ncbi:MAG: DUF1127 domain-containing protein [Cellvibrionaceae bacterium]|nr:DUF1127 domain-containing protein [Cellvibrionaceae bacterium]